jgi:hypothetical protein
MKSCPPSRAAAFGTSVSDRGYRLRFSQSGLEPVTDEPNLSRAIPQGGDFLWAVPILEPGALPVGCRVSFRYPPREIRFASWAAHSASR